MESIHPTVGTGSRQIVYHVLFTLTGGMLLGAAVALKLPRSFHLDAVIFSLLAVFGLVSVLMNASAFQRARFDLVAVFLALGFIISGPCYLTVYPPSLNDLGTGLREYIFLIAMAASAVVIMVPATARARQLSDRITSEEGALPSEPCNSSTSRLLDSISSVSHLDFLPNPGLMDLKFMSGPGSQYSNHSGSEESAITLSSGLMRDPGKTMEIIQWVAAAAPPAFGRKGDQTSTDPVIQDISL
ncbi:uncharacterized protein FIESC28_10544 [Fusarium coffeatum]|uniref:Uncharacterized protein n=1 Tax=Fusarium coffeatum TaxID=231269 RepID=A0A366QUI7_9HYPO|nr:uncharacterized protein FIESC28_10544 [Fusarium coffeatum]RBR07645.1 hypothetical protein FIESC28_10544 [Fusarium coffeatum]